MVEVLIIIRLSLELALEAVKSMTPEQAEAFWARHEARMKFWETAYAKLTNQS